MFYLGWITLTVIGILASIIVFFWALRTGQFSDQGRARYLPFRGERTLPVANNPGKTPIEVYALLVALGIGLLGLGVTVVMTLFPVRG